ncbi:winged helix-turn-helix domain-containing protein [Holospora undulata]|uniref:DNA-binding transcriptional regulator BasR n=1 Tax=Holospora undulata HU1 TaxID=1321371 RepID=A0A061JI17_9PROT|nr:winged helix-turn-helix domain-containing protein [Holospora undulata]ETZ05177.1 DNA-binding transcriptional regulator BasR [Holospora undulata HU1]
MIRVVRRKLLCYGDVLWCSLWEEIIQQSCAEITLSFCSTEVQLRESWEKKSSLACVYVMNNRCVFEDWISKKFYLLPEFFLVFLGDLKAFQQKVGYVLKDFSFYHNTIITKKRNFLLREKEYKTLVYFLERYKEKINKEELLKEVWKYSNDMETLTLETHVAQLNKKLKFCNHRIRREKNFFLMDSIGEI